MVFFVSFQGVGEAYCLIVDALFAKVGRSSTLYPLTVTVLVAVERSTGGSLDKVTVVVSCRSDPEYGVACVYPLAMEVMPLR